LNRGFESLQGFCIGPGPQQILAFPAPLMGNVRCFPDSFLNHAVIVSGCVEMSIVKYEPTVIRRCGGRAIAKNIFRLEWSFFVFRRSRVDPRPFGVGDPTSGRDKPRPYSPFENHLENGTEF